MKGKFDIGGRPAAHPPPSSTEEALDRFIEGAEPMTTMTVQIPERLKHAFKRAALDRKTTVKALLIQAMEDLLAASKQ
jgi:hypothetical protein